jgi:hypothetical protein
MRFIQLLILASLIEPVTASDKSKVTHCLPETWSAMTRQGLSARAYDRILKVNVRLG